MINKKVATAVVILSIIFYRYYVPNSYGFITYTSWIVQTFENKILGSGRFQNNNKLTEEPRVDLYSREELGLYDGKPGSKGLYLGLLGKVYDVSKGSQHYGPNGGYHFFAGRDASRAFVSGDFSEAGLTDDIEGLSSKDILGLEKWEQFYTKDYKCIGKVIGRFYNADGSKTPYMLDFEEMLYAAHLDEKKEADEKLYFPPCNSEWSQDKGGRVYCTKKSGGIHREWVGVPRRYFDSDGQQVKCVCVRNYGPPTLRDVPDKGRGDLDDPRLKEYENCDESASSCVVK